MLSTGMSRAAFRTRKPPRAGRPAWKVAEEYKRWLRKLPCACEGKNPWCQGATEAAHVDLAAKGTRDAKGASSKVADRFCIPLSRGCHDQQTRVMGWLAFEQTLPGRDAEALSGIYWTEWPGHLAWERAERERIEAAL